MIGILETYFENLFKPEQITFGQIQDDVDNLVNMNIYDTGKTPYFGDEKTHILTLNLYIRDKSFESLQDRNESIGNSLCNTYDKIISNCHLVHIKKRGGQEPRRDSKNRYSIYSNYEIKIEEV